MSRSNAKLKVGYVPYSADFRAAGDRRRFCRYAALRGIEFEKAHPDRRYDLVVVSSLADLTTWSRAGTNVGKVIFDLPDSYLDIERTELKSILRGPMKYLLRQHAHLEWSFHESLIRMCERADGVICSTPEQRARLVQHNANTHAILDFHTAAARRVKTDFALGETVRFLWEGMAGNIFTLGEIAEVLRNLAKRRRIALHLVTDVEYKPFNGPVPKVSSRRVIDKVLHGVPTFLHEWDEDLFPTICTSCDLGVIPMVSQPIFRAKAENKLLLLWRMGVPTITADTPAYVRTMRDAGVRMTCASQVEWIDVIDRYLADATLREEAAKAGKHYAETEHGEVAVLERWDRLFQSVTT